jgi:hypothetical protein
MLRAYYEGTPASFPVQALNAMSPKYWEAGAIGMLDANGAVVVSDGSSGQIGVLADRRNTTVGIASQTFLPSNPYGAGSYGDESLFNQPGYGNSLYGTTTNSGITSNNVIPANTIPTTTLLRDETAANPNVNARYVTVYIRGGQYQTDQYDSTKTYVPNTPLYVMTDGTGRLTNVAATLPQVGVCLAPVDGNGQLKFELTLV